jgi:lipopolysaccharide/colanic/teichoic acid biosynthesis glycosyltransferase
VPFQYQEKPLYDVVTRAMNAVVALLGLIGLSPLLLTIALAIKLSEPTAPVLYRGRRMGKGGSPFEILKFRTMVPGTEGVIGAKLVDRDSAFITPIGRLLRRRKLDELPQLFSVLRGDMNLVGPRPAREVLLEELRGRILGYDRRFLVRPGVTGLAQVKGGYYTDPRNKLRYELLYIMRRSVWLDLKLIAATVFIMASRTLTMLSLLFFLLAFVIFIPTSFLPSLHLTLLGVQVNIVFLFISCLIAGWLARGLLRRGFMLRRTPLDRYITGFVLWAVLGALLNPNALQNLLGVLYFCSGAFALYFLASQTIDRDVGRVRRSMRGLGLITIAVSLWGLLDYATGGGINDGGVRAVSSLGDPNVLALFLAMALPLLFYLRLSSAGRHARLAWTTGMLLSAMCLILTFSRSGYIAFVTVVLAFLSRWHHRWFCVALAVSISLAAVAEISGIERLSMRSTVTSPQGRRMVHLYATVLSGATDHLLLGIGWRNWKGAVDRGQSDHEGISLGPVSLPRTLKNMYMTLLVEQGLVGLFFMLLIFVAALQACYRGSYQVPDRSLQVLLWAIFSSALGFMANMLFFDSFYFVAVQVTFWLLLGLGIGLATEFGTGSPRMYRMAVFEH